MARRPKPGKKPLKPPKESSTEVWSLLKKLELAEPTYELTGKLRELNLRRAWQEAVGDSIARRSAATALSRGTLHVVVESPAWRNELVFIEADIVRRVNERYRELLPKDPAGPPVKRLRLAVGALPDPLPPARTPRSPLSPATRDEAAEVESRLCDVKDPELREAARRMLLAAVRAEREARGRR